jgi:hypothetical protein
LGELAVVNDELRRRKRECREALGAGEAKVRGESLRGRALRSFFTSSSENGASAARGAQEARASSALKLANVKKKRRRNRRALK